MNLLIVDDDTICSYINNRVAQTAGVFEDIKSVHNGKDALEYFGEVSDGRQAAPDIILLDLNMPVMSGFDFIAALDALSFPKKENVQIIILTSSDDAVDIQRARSLGIDHYLLKPLTVNHLHEVMFCRSKAREKRSLAPDNDYRQSAA